MRLILWFRRDLRTKDSAILSHAQGEVLPIFIFDPDILGQLPADDKRVSFIYRSVQRLREQLRTIGLDLSVYYGRPREVFESLLAKCAFDEVLCSCDFDSYAITRDMEIETLLPMRRFYDSFLLHPDDTLKNDGTPYKVFTPFYNSFEPLWSSSHLEEFVRSDTMRLMEWEYQSGVSLEEMGFEVQELPEFLSLDPFEVLDEFLPKLANYRHDRDYFAIEATSRMSVFLRFGLISPRQLCNRVRGHDGDAFYIRELYWREFYNAILYHFPQSERENWNGREIGWREDREQFAAWCEGRTGIPIVDAAMRHLGATGTMHNRLRMIVASYLCKNLFLPWQWGEEYFALKLLDYEASSNIGSWQWGASTGADSVPYFRVFNPYTQSEKFDKEAKFIKSVIPELADIDARLIHRENGVQSNIFVDYPSQLVDIRSSRAEAIERFRRV